jgi:alpha-tubulin suppressor-like RCC1 family protein
MNDEGIRIVSTKSRCKEAPGIILSSADEVVYYIPTSCDLDTNTRHITIAEDVGSSGILSSWLSTPVKVKINIAACGKNVVVFNDALGQLWTFGFNIVRQACHPSMQRMSSDPLMEKVADGINAKQLAVGDSHILILTHSSELYSYGRGDSGELGTGCRLLWSDKPQKVSLPDNNETLNQIAAGSRFSAVISKPSNFLYTFGCGAYFRLGHGSDEDCLSPTKVTALEGVGTMIDYGSGGGCSWSGIKAVACGSWHAVAVAADTNDVYTWGWNKFGQCGGGMKYYDRSMANLTTLPSLYRSILSIPADPFIPTSLDSHNISSYFLHHSLLFFFFFCSHLMNGIRFYSSRRCW